MNRLAVVVLNWNGMSDTLDCIASLRKQTQPHTIVLVDNGSTEELSVQTLKGFNEKPQNDLIILQNSENQGFSGGVNTGIRYCIDHNYDYVALFNNDAVADTNWLSNLASQTKITTAKIVTGLLLHSDGKTIDSTGDWYSIWGLPFPRARNEPSSSAPKSGYVFGASGGASLYSVDMLKEIGLFDEVFFAYYEDVDISFRAQLAGYKVYYDKKAVAYHKQGATSSKIPGFTVYQTMKNLPLLYIKNVPAGLLFVVGIRFWFAYALFFLNAVRKGSGLSATRGVLAGIYYFWGHGIKERIRIQRTRKVNTNSIRSMLVNDLPPDQTGLRRLRAFFTNAK